MKPSGLLQQSLANVSLGEEVRSVQQLRCLPGLLVNPISRNQINLMILSKF
jgi:hypothetical protein